MERDEMTSEEADGLIAGMRAEVRYGTDPEEILWDIDLEPGYAFDLIKNTSPSLMDGVP